MGDLSEHFSSSEFACGCGCGSSEVHERLVAALESVRGYCELPLIITSGRRCEQHNKLVGGHPRSPHLEGLAADIWCVDSDRRYRLLEAIAQSKITRYGIGKDFIHVDVSKTLRQEWVWVYD